MLSNTLRAVIFVFFLMPSPSKAEDARSLFIDRVGDWTVLGSVLIPSNTIICSMLKRTINDRNFIYMVKINSGTLGDFNMNAYFIITTDQKYTSFPSVNLFFDGSSLMPFASKFDDGELKIDINRTTDELSKILNLLKDSHMLHISISDNKNNVEYIDVNLDKSTAAFNRTGECMKYVMGKISNLP